MTFTPPGRLASLLGSRWSRTSGDDVMIFLVPVVVALFSLRLGGQWGPTQVSFGAARTPVLIFASVVGALAPRAWTSIGVANVMPRKHAAAVARSVGKIGGVFTSFSFGSSPDMRFTL